MGITILGVGGIIAILGLIVLIILWISAYTRAADIYGTVGSAMDYAVASASIMNSTGTSNREENDAYGVDRILHDQEVMRYFIGAFCQITDGSYSGGEFSVPGLPGNILLQDFYLVSPGAPIPPQPTGPGMPQLRGEKASQPGYVVYLDVPIYAGGLWEIQPARVQMKIYRILQSSPIQGG